MEIIRGTWAWLPTLDVRTRAIFDIPENTRWPIPKIKYDSTGTIQYQSNPPSDLESLRNGLSIVGLIYGNLNSVLGFLGNVPYYNIRIDTDSRPRELLTWDTHVLYDSTRDRGNGMFFQHSHEVPFYTPRSIRSLLARAIQFLNIYLNSCKYYK